MTAVVLEVDAHEGPVYVPDEDALYFTSVPAPEVAIKRLPLARTRRHLHRLILSPFDTGPSVRRPCRLATLMNMFRPSFWRTGGGELRPAASRSISIFSSPDADSCGSGE